MIVIRPIGPHPGGFEFVSEAFPLAWRAVLRHRPWWRRWLALGRRKPAAA